MPSESLKKYATLNNLTFVLASVQFAWLVWFFYTGLGGALELVARVMSIALALQILFMYQQDYFYKWLPPIANHLLVARLSRHLRTLPSFISTTSSNGSRSIRRARSRRTTTSSGCWFSCW